jgi:hypothetical protein
MNKLLMIGVMMFGLAACGEDDVPQEIVDQNMIISQRNAEFNATKFRNERFPDALRVMMDSDSTISRLVVLVTVGQAVLWKCQTAQK